MKKNFCLYVILITVAILVGIFCWPTPYAEEWEYCKEYLEARSNTIYFEELASYIHYEDEGKYDLMKTCRDRLISYKRLDAKRINDSLVVFSLKLHIGYAEKEETKRVYYFIGKIDGEYRMMLSAKNVPLELREGLDLNDFSGSVNALDPNTDFIFPLN